MIDKRNLIIGILVLVILIGSTVFAYEKITEKVYLSGFVDGQANFYNQLIGSLSQSGEVTIPVTVENQTVPITLVIKQTNE